MAQEIKTIRNDLRFKLDSEYIHVDGELQQNVLELQRKLYYYLGLEKEEVRQKSRQDWLKLGDSNTKFFYAAMRSRQSINSLAHFCDIEGKPMDGLRSIKECAPAFFEDLFTQDSYWRVFPNIQPRKILQPGAASWIGRRVTSSEIKVALFDIGADKAPGPDGFNGRFFQENWSVFQTDVTCAIMSFFEGTKLPAGINHTHISLVPKSATASVIQDYRPIACCNVLYKIIAKVLSNRLWVVLPHIIADNQRAFIKGRAISNCTLLAHEIVRDFNGAMGAKLCLKLD